MAVDIGRMALVIIDMQRDFLEPGGFGAAIGNDISRLKSAVGPCADVLAAARLAPGAHLAVSHEPLLDDGSVQASPVSVVSGDHRVRRNRAKVTGCCSASSRRGPRSNRRCGRGR